MPAHSAPLTVATAAALATGVTLGSLGSNVMPVLLAGVIKTSDLSSTVAGAIGTAQLLATALVVLALTGLAGRPGRVRIARWGLVLAATGFAASILAPDAFTLGLTNVLAGAGMGVVGAMALAGLPNTADPDRATKIVVLVNVIGVAVMVAAIAAVNEAFGPQSGFALIALICLGALALVGRLPDAPPPAERSESSRPGLPHKAVGAALCLGAAIFAATDLGLWAHAERLGREHAGLDEKVLVGVLVGGVLAGLVGVVVAAAMVGRWRHTAPLIGFLVFGGVLKVVISLTTSPTVFAVAIIAWNTTYPAVVLLLLTIAASLDVRGRWNTALGGAIGLGTAIGPLASGVALDAGHVMLGAELGTGVAVALALIVMVSTTTDRRPAPVVTAPVSLSAE